MSDVQESVRQPILGFLQGGTDNLLEEEAVVIGFALIVECIGKDGTRAITKITSDAGGQPLTYYTTEGLAIALNNEPEGDEEFEVDDLGS